MKVIVIKLSVMIPMYEAIQKYFDEMGIKKVVIYGYKEKIHTHYWIQSAFYRAFAFLQEAGIPFELTWDDNRSLLRSKDLENTLVIGNLNVGNVDFALPLTDKAYYIVHNHAPKRLNARRYRNLKEAGRCITFEVFRGKVYDDTHAPINKEPCHALSILHSNAVLTWGTDLLPDEIEQNIEKVRSEFSQNKQNRQVVFVGSIWRVNKDAITDVINYCIENNLSFDQYGGYVVKDFNPCTHSNVSFHKQYIDLETNAKLIRDAYIAPAIQGKSQLSNSEDVGNYVPCRIFKNISYGNFGVTNNATANALFDNKLIYHSDISELMKLAEIHTKDVNACNTLLQLMDEVKTKHTYINRIETLLFALSSCFRAKSKSPSVIKTPHLSNAVRRGAAATAQFFTGSLRCTRIL